MLRYVRRTIAGGGSYHPGTLHPRAIMVDTNIPAADRPRPGPARSLVLFAFGVVVVASAFALFVAIGWGRAAAALLFVPPLADLALRRGGVRAYVDRHTGIDASSHTLMTVWAAGLAAVFAAGDAPGPVGVAAGLAAIGAVAAAVSRIVWARFPPQLDAHRLEQSDRARSDLRWFDRTSRRYERIEAAPVVLGIAIQLLTSSLLVADPSSGAAVGSAVVVLAVYGLRGIAVLGGAVRRIRVGDHALRAAIGADIAAHRPELLVHFSGSVNTMYQLDQWMPHILSTGRSVLLVTREMPTFEAAINRWSVPIVYIRQFPDLDLVVTPSSRLAIYVNTGTKNNQLVRFGDLTHVQLHHGDSDKPPSSGKTMRLYDHHIVAGPAAVDRLGAVGIPSADDAISMVGRPVTDRLESGPLEHDRPVVLYAPTWEGYHVDSALSSVGSMGEPIVRRTPESIDLVVRTHPLTGTVDRRLKTAVQTLRRLTNDRGSAGSFVGPGDPEDLLDSMSAADLLVCDVSSVLVDFLVTDRPIAVCDVGGLGEDELHRRYPTTSGAAVLAPDLSNYEEVMADAFGADARQERRRQTRDRLLITVGDAESRFHEAIAALVAQTDRAVAS